MDIQIQGDQVIITSQQTVAKADYRAQQESRLGELQYSLSIAQSQLDSINAAITDINSVIQSLNQE